MYYKTGYCFTSRDLFDNFNVKQINTPTHIFTKKYNCTCKKELCAKILTYCFYLIIFDIIENNATFVLPTKNKTSNLFVKQFSGDTFKRMYQKGKFLGIDFLNSNFKGYQIYFQYAYKGGIREKPIYISSKLKELFYSKINEGKQYY